MGSKVVVAEAESYNGKERNINEGLHALLIAESYMANFGLTKLEFFNQRDERNRVLGNLENLLHADDAIYIPRPIIPDKFVDLVIPTVCLLTLAIPLFVLILFSLLARCPHGNLPG